MSLSPFRAERDAVMCLPVNPPCAASLVQREVVLTSLARDFREYKMYVYVVAEIDG